MMFIVCVVFVVYSHLAQRDHLVVQLVEGRQVKGHQALVQVDVDLRLLRVLVKVLQRRLALDVWEVWRV